MSENIKLSIVCITYNHERFIRDCLEGFVMQKTDFPFEILINDDASTDKTADIIREYEAKYPHLFRCVYQTENQWGKKAVGKDILFPMVRGKYVALCEGDDYWTDPLKLQKQVDFLDAHPDFSVCFHPVTVHWDDGSKPDSIFPIEKERFYKTELTLADLLERNFIQTNSVVYRWRFHQDSLNLIPDNILPADWFLHLLHAQIGKIAFLQDIMAVYRRNQNGIWTDMMKNEEWFEKCGLAYLHFLEEKQHVFLCNENDTILFTLATLFQKCNQKSPVYEKAKKIYSEECSMIKRSRFVFIKYIFYSFLKVVSLGKNKKKVSKLKRLYKQLFNIRLKSLKDFCLMKICGIKNKFRFSYKNIENGKHIYKSMFGLYKKTRKNNIRKYYFCGIRIWKKDTYIYDQIELQKNALLMLQDKIKSDILNDINEKISYQISLINVNFITQLIFENRDANIFYIKAPCLTVIFQRKFLRFDIDFIKDFFLKTSAYNQFYNIGVLPKSSHLYQEHIQAFNKENILCFKYAYRGGVIARTVISFDPATDELYFEGKILGKQNYQIDSGRNIVDTPKRKIISGPTLMDSVQHLDLEDQKKIFTSFFEWFFSTYESKQDKSKVIGIIADCHPNNFLIHDGQFVCIDFDARLEYDVPKNVCLWRALENGSHPLYHYFSELYGLEELKPDYPHPFFTKNQNMEKAAKANKELIDKYFSENAFAPNPFLKQT